METPDIYARRRLQVVADADPGALPDRDRQGVTRSTSAFKLRVGSRPDGLGVLDNAAIGAGSPSTWRDTVVNVAMN